MHPPRLGGKYYRGNDERNDSLFNRGFYRTATIDLHLVNSEGTRLKWEDKVDNDTQVEILIRRAPKATKELFSERVRKLTSIEHYCQTTKAAKEKLKLEVLEKDDLWSVTIPLPPQDQWAEGRVEGMILSLIHISEPTRPY